MVINMDETKLRTIAQLQEFLDATPEVKFTLAAGVGDTGLVQQPVQIVASHDLTLLIR